MTSPRFLQLSLVLVLFAASAAARAEIEVPLSLWTHDDFPEGLDFGETMGISWGDYDADGFIDLFACHSAHLWRNVGGATWELAADLDAVLPPAERRYGASFGDYNRDGLPDLGTEPRVPFWGDDKMHLLKNLGGGPNFVDVAGDPLIVDTQPFQNGETLCWADVDGDRNLDAFLPVYPPWAGGPGNFFLHNLGPTGPGGDYRFTEISAGAGLDNPPPDSGRPEGAQFADIDFDGDVDLYSNGTLYQNRSSLGQPQFIVLAESDSGIGLRSSRDEGAMFFDYDLDGDQDLVVVYIAEGVRIWENHGDGTFFPAEVSLVDSPLTGLNLGMSAEDWDNDGDIDFTTREVFRRNRLVEDGAPHFTVATHELPSAHIHSATPAWGDWDNDGDLDAAIGNWGETGNFYENTLYSSETPAAQRRHVRVRVLGEDADVPAGLETEYGAVAEIHIAGAEDGYRRRKFVASSHGYLNQNAYALHFGLPPDPAPDDDAEDVELELSVDFPELPQRGTWRVDRHINPVLEGLHLADLDDREIEVRRCGGVTLDGVRHDPNPFASPLLSTAGGGLALAGPNGGLPEPTESASPHQFVGIVFNTHGADDAIEIREIVLDGQLAPPVDCGSGEMNIGLWDITDIDQPLLVQGGSWERTTSPRNRRSYFRTSVVLEAKRNFRLVARVSAFRASPLAASPNAEPVRVDGGVTFVDGMPCDGSPGAVTSPNPSLTYLSFRYATAVPQGEFDSVGDSLRLSLQPQSKPVLSWEEIGTPGYEIRTCDATAGPCTPIATSLSLSSPHVDDPPPGAMLWYSVQAVNACATALWLP
ncbi:MAG: VCBS repeat-containing protein [bacterium]|nr:VCBS repeat-containing protein [bacterium]